MGVQYMYILKLYVNFLYPLLQHKLWELEGESLGFTFPGLLGCLKDWTNLETHKKACEIKDCVFKN